MNSWLHSLFHVSASTTSPEGGRATAEVLSLQEDHQKSSSPMQGGGDSVAGFLSSFWIEAECLSMDQEAM